MTDDQAKSATGGAAPSQTGRVARLLSRFTDPSPEYGPLPLWWWSGATVTGERLRRQMELLLAQGVHQAVVICLAPTGPMFGSLADDPPYLSPEWLTLLDGACADAEELGFTLWMYDQIGFSGANFQGLLTARDPEFAGLGLYRTTASTDGGPAVVRPPAGHTALAAYATALDGERAVPPVPVPVDAADGAARWEGAPVRLTLVHSGVSGFDYFGTEACAALLDQVHGTLERHVGKWFGRSIGGFFQDELPALPTWGRDFAATFTAAYGYDLVPRLAALWEGEDDASARVRRDYQEHRAALGRRAFFGPQRAYFERHGLICGFDQPSPAREGDPVGGVKVYGDYHATHRGYGAPGSDHWGDAKVHSSMAHANGEPRTWIEAFHSSGWGGTLEETYDWLAPFLRRGANLYDPHAVYYATPGGWWEWAPPSTCWRQPYWPDYHVFAGAVARLCSVLTAGHHVCDTVLLSPTTTAQSYLTPDGPLAPARESAALYHRLNGVSTWYAERRGVLESAGLDHDVLDETALAHARVAQDAAGATLSAGAETYRTVVLPGPRALHTAAAATLAGFARAGGRVVCVGRAPELFLGAGDGDHDDEEGGRGSAPGDGGEAFADALAAGLIRVVAEPEQVPAAVATGPLRVVADAPCLLRRDGATHILALTAHDGVTGTRAPIVSLGTDDWTTQDNFSWSEYWRQLHEDGYTYVPSAGRTASVRIEGPARAPRAQRWDPGTGARTELAVSPADGGGWRLDVPFADGAVALVVFGDDLPVPTRRPLGAAAAVLEVDGPWRVLASSTLDNRWGDLAAADRRGILPAEVWRMEHREGGTGEWRPVTAGFGPFALVRHGDGEYEPVEWSLSRGIRDDPVHDYRLGPKGYVPEEFLDVREVREGGEVSVRTHLALPAGPGPRWLAVGANAARRVRADGVDLPVEGGGYQTFSPLPAEAAGTAVALDLVLTAREDGPVRASFAVVRDPDAYRRPEWMSAGPGGHPGRTYDLTRRLALERLPADPVVQVGSDGACTVLVNGVEVGRQGDFNPYPGHREVRVHPYDLGGVLRVGENILTLRLTDPDGGPTAAALDSAPVERGGLGLLSDARWSAVADGAVAPVVLRPTHLGRDPRSLCAWARPHPLPGAHWLEPAAAQGGVVEPVVPDLAPGPVREEWLRFTAPLGARSLRVPTSLRTTLETGGRTYVPDATGRVRLPAPAGAGTRVVLRVAAVDGRRGGALLDGPVTAELAEVLAPLASWEELGLRALGGAVRYRTGLTLPAGPPRGRAVLDLGAVRGTAEVTVNGVPCGTRVWGPWTAEVTGALRGGANTVEVVVRGTLAGYLDDASPTRAIAAGQVRTGLFGPVRLLVYEAGADA
ncbi:hypothetical protein [Streptomyces sp. DW26H14]|uniref:hypothetical protein n=1 Tax=Streptomyces sp. DW26H14 TaxID=3435395 RepID=UPI00403DDEDD